METSSSSVMIAAGQPDICPAPDLKQHLGSGSFLPPAESLTAENNATQTQQDVQVQDSMHFGSSGLLGSAASAENVQLALDVCYTSAESGVRSYKRLPLDFITGVEDLRGLFRSLIAGAFPSSLPDYLTSFDYYKFAPANEYASFPGDAIDTKFRLIASFRGWEINVAERELGGSVDPDRKLLVTVAEFESEPFELSDGTEVIVTMVTYPTVSVQRAFLDEALQKLMTAVAAAGGGHLASNGSFGQLEDDASSAATRAQLQL